MNCSKKLCLWVFFLILSKNTHANPDLLLKINQKGFDFISQSIFSEYLKPIKDKNLGEINTTIDHGIKVTSSPLSFSMKFTSFELKPNKDHLSLDLGIKDLTIYAPRIRAKKKIIFTISSTCYDTYLHIAKNKPLSLKSTLKLKVVNNRVRIDPNINIHIDDSQFEIKGPRTCSGKLGIGKLIRNIFRKVLKKSKPKIEEHIRTLVLSTVPQLENMLTKTSHQRFPLLTLRNNKQLIISTSPTSILMNADGTTMGLKAEFSEQDTPLTDNYLQNQIYALGEFSFHQKLLNNLTAKILGSLDHQLIINHLSDNINDLLHKDNLTQVWPLLSSVPSDKDYLRLRVEFLQTPEFTVHNHNTIDVSLSNLRLVFQIHDEHWQDFFYINSDFYFSTKVSIQDNLIRLSLNEHHIINIKGQWSDKYQSSDGVFHEDIFIETLTAVFDLLKEIPFTFKSPQIHIWNKQLFFNQVAANNPYLDFGIWFFFNTN